MLDVIICAKFGVKKLRCLGNTRGQILEFPIEMAGHLYNRAGATAQPVIQRLIGQKSQILPTPSHLAPSFRVTPSNLWKSFTVSETKVFQAADGEDLVILACTVFD